MKYLLSHILCILGYKCYLNYGSQIPKNIQCDIRFQIGKRLLVGSSLLMPALYNSEDSHAKTVISLADSAQLIDSYCKVALQATRLTGRLLYRGEGRASDVQQCIIETNNSSPPDLLYGSAYSTFALDYFNSLDEELTLRNNEEISQLLTNCSNSSPHILLSYPSDVAKKVSLMKNDRLIVGNAHIASSDIQIASRWGIPVSVWPFDEKLHYACKYFQL